MALVQPYQEWATERAQNLAREQASRQVQAAASNAMAQAVANIRPEQRTTHPLPHDWAASDRLAAQRAMGLEARQQQHGYQMEELERRAALGREDDLWKIKLRQRFAPKGAGPIATLLKEYVKLATDKEPGESTTQRQGRLQMLHTQIGRLGRGGAQVAKDITDSGFGPERYTVKPQSEREAEAAVAKEKALDVRSQATNLSRVEAAKAGAEVRSKSSQTVSQLRALQALAKDPKDMFSDTKESKAQREDARRKLATLAETLGGRSVGGKVYFPAAGGGYTTDDDDED
jgi:hypothetical protein